MCDQAVTKKAQLTHIKFNPIDKIMLIGDYNSGVSVYKLSPNLLKSYIDDK